MLKERRIGGKGEGWEGGPEMVQVNLVVSVGMTHSVSCLDGQLPLSALCVLTRCRLLSSSLSAQCRGLHTVGPQYNSADYWNPPCLRPVLILVNKILHGKWFACLGN